MLATQRMSPPNPLLNRNQAGGPLPLIPRRLSRESSAATPIKVVVHQSSPPLAFDDSGSSSSSDSGRPTISLRAKRVHSEAPRQPPLLYSPGVSLRLTTSRNFSESHAQPPAPLASSQSSSSLLPTSQSQPRLIRKKSGQLVKSSLKPSKSLSLLTPRSPYLNSKSAPATPTHAPKAVHFDAQLEHVKLFLAEQKPLAVSRDGSPTEDTASGTDTDFPDWIFGSSSLPPTRNLTMHTLNMPTRLSAESDVLLESLTLSPDSPSVVGRVRVANLAFTKSVVARFTFDAWQTTSEVSAHYVSSPSPRTDIFVFSVRLNDLMARIDGKRMLLAVRYNVGGREVWDNNDGRDYLVEFGLESKSKSKSTPALSTSTSTPTSTPTFFKEREAPSKDKEPKDKEDRGRRPTPDASTIASLRSTLEKVVPPTPARTVPRYDFSQSLANAPHARWAPPALPHTPLAHSRTPAHTHTHARAQSYPSPGSTPRPKSFPAAATPTPKANANSVPWPIQQKPTKARWTPPLGSPRDASDEDRPPFTSVPNYARETEDLPFAVPPPSSAAAGARHHRRGYFEGANAGMGSGVRRTPPGTPPMLSDSDADEEEGADCEAEVEFEAEEDTDGVETPMPGRFYSFPPTRAGLGFFTGQCAERVEDSEVSTPSLGSSRDNSPSPSPSPSPTESEVLTETDDTEMEGDGQEESGGSYKEFLSRFCFFTGTGAGTGVGIFADSPTSASPSPSPNTVSRRPPSHSAHVRAQTYPQKRFIVPRTQSASEIEDVLPRQQERERAVRSPSFEDVLLGSGATTPIAHHMSPQSEVPI